MAWFKTFRKGQKIPKEGNSSAAFAYSGMVDAGSFPQYDIHRYQPTPGSIQRERVIMGYEDTVRAARKYDVDSAPVFMTSVKGKIYLTDYTETIRVYNTNGKRLPSVHADSRHSMLSGLASNTNENSLFVCDAHAKNEARVQIFNISNDITPVVYLGHGLFEAPHGVAVTTDNRTLVTDVGRKEIFIIQDDGYNALCFGGSGRRPGLFAYPHDVVYDADYKRVIVSDTHNHRIQVFDDYGRFLKVLDVDHMGRKRFNFPTGMQFDPNGNLLVCDKDSLHILTPDLQLYRTIAMTSMGLVKPTAIALLPYNRLCVCSCDESSIVIF